MFKILTGIFLANWLKVVPIILLITLGPNVNGQDCEKLKDGKYKIKFKGQNHTTSKYLLIIEQDHFTQLSNGTETKGIIEINQDCILRLDYLIKWDTTIQVQRIFSHSAKPYFEFESTRGKKLKFRLTGYGGPHVTAGEGVFIPLN